MENKKRWSSKEEAKEYALNCFNKGVMGLSFCAAIDYVGDKVLKDIKNISMVRQSIYADSLLSRGLKDTFKEIDDLKYELYYEDFKSAAEYDECLLSLATALDTAEYIIIWHKNHKRFLRRKR